MVQFTPYESPDRVKEYDFREPEGRKANSFWGNLAKGGADLLDSGVKAADTATKLTIDETARGDVNFARQQNINEQKELVGNILAVTQKGAQSPTGGSTAPVANASVSDPSALINAPAGSPVAPTAIPGPITSEIRYVDKMNEGMKQGHFDSERFYGEVQQRTANLISRYPGYADYIQSKVTHYLGTDPANAQREHLQHTIAQLLGTSHTQTQQEKWNTEVMTHYAPSMGPEWTSKALAAGTNMESQNNYRVQATAQLSKDYRITKDTQALANHKAGVEAKSTAAATNFTSIMDNKYGKFMNTSVMGVDGEHQYTMPDVHASIATQALTGKIDLEKNQKQALAVGAAKTEYFRDFENEWIRPRKEFGVNAKGEPTDSFSTLITDPSAKEAIMKKYRTGFDAVAEQLGAGLGHLATTQASMGTNITDNAVLQILKNEGAASVAAISKAYGTSANTIIGNMDTQSGYKVSSALGRQALEAFNVKTLATGAANGNTLKDQFDRVVAINNADHKFAGQKPTPKEMETMMTQLTNVIRMPNGQAPLPMKMNVMDVLTHPETVNFLNQVNKTQQFAAYSTLFSTDVTNFIKDHQATEMWTRYKNTAGQSFAMIYGNFVNDIKVQVRNDYRGDYTWDEKSQQIIYTPTRSFGQAIDRNSNPAKQATDVVNQGLRVYAGVLAGEGKKITQEDMAALGIDLNRPEGNPTLDGIKNAWKQLPSTVAEAAKEAAKKATETVSTSTSRPEGIDSPSRGRIPKGPRNPELPGDSKSSSPASPGDQRNGNELSLEEINSWMDRKLHINGVEITNKLDKATHLSNVIKTPEGKYYYKQGDRLVPINP